MVIGWDSKTDTYFISGINDKEAMSVYASCCLWKFLEKHPDIPISGGNGEIIIKTLKEIESGLHIAHSMKVERS